LGFIQAIKEHAIKAIMPAHIIFTEVDPENPVGFSRKWLQDILRKECEFEGAIISDCLSMKGAEVGNMLERATRALNAGCDIIIVCNQTREVIQSLLNDLSRSFKIDAVSQRRIAALAHINRF
jgi:beta-N-acetylhexosaminidase